MRRRRRPIAWRHRSVDSFKNCHSERVQTTGPDRIDRLVPLGTEPACTEGTTHGRPGPARRPFQPGHTRGPPFWDAPPLAARRKHVRSAAAGPGGTARPGQPAATSSRASAAHWQMPGHATAKVRRRMKGRAPQAGSCCELKFAEFRAATQADSEKRTGICAQLEGEYTMSTPPMTRSRCRA